MMKNKAVLVFSAWLSLASFLPVGLSYGAAEDCTRKVEELSRLKGLLDRHNFLKEAISACPDDYQIVYYYAYSQERLRKYEEALRYYKKAIALNPGFAKSYFGMGDVYLALKKNREAVAALEKGLQLDPDNIWAKRSHEKAVQRAGGAREMRDEKAVAAATVQPPSVPAQPSAPAVPVAAVPAVAAVASPVAAESDSGGEVVNAAGLTGEPLVTVRFLMSSNELTDEAREKLESLVCSALGGNSGSSPSRFEISGHTDDSGVFAHNMLLSRIRAEVVRDFLVEKCGATPQQLTVTYYGQSRPMVANSSRDNRRLNRRVEVRRLE